MKPFTMLERPAPRWRSVAPLMLVLAACWVPQHAFAQASSGNEAALLERIRLLEQRLEQLERGNARNGTARRTAGAPAPAPAPRADAPAPAATPAAAAAAPPPGRPAAPRAGASLPAAQASAAGRQGEEIQEIPQEAFIFRDQAVTLRPGRYEASFDVAYTRSRRTLTSDRMLSGGATLRAGLFDGIEGSINIPFFHSTRSIDTGPGVVNDRELTNIGDVGMQVNFRGWGERDRIPGAVFSVGVSAPTGPAPFVVSPLGISETILPVDPLRLYNTRGAWAVRGGVQFFKTVDPVVLFGGAAYEYAFETERQGVTFQPGQRYTYNAGMSFAMSDISTLGITFLGSYTTRLRADRFVYRSSAQETAALRFALVQRLADTLWVEPSLAIGLVQESPSFQLGLGLRYRF